jgi:tRNA U34 5-methylaminomethyl-2-thiouridine-forming methyltransferase MnmC
MDKLLKLTKEGSHTILSTQFDATYHSHHGAIQETRTVFIEAGFLHLVEVGYKRIDLLEIGFGTGLNAFMTLLQAKETRTAVNYVSYEAYPIGEELAAQLNYPSLLAAESDENSFQQMHQHPDKPIQFKMDKETIFDFLLKVELFENIDYHENFDLIYFDAFAPSTQAYLWEVPFLEKMYKALRPDGVLVTYCAQGAFKRALKAVGFQVKGLPGPIGKREITFAKKIK